MKWTKTFFGKILYDSLTRAADPVDIEKQKKIERILDIHGKKSLTMEERVEHGRLMQDYYDHKACERIASSIYAKKALDDRELRYYHDHWHYPEFHGVPVPQQLAESVAS